jgi:hypothetical protein
MALEFTENIVVGRRANQLKKYNEKATGYIGKVMVSSGDDPVLGKKVLMDLSRSHVAIVCGKRGGGKCLTENSLITLENGSEIPIKELDKKNKKIIALNSNLKLKKTKKNKFFKRTVNKILKIKLKTGKELELTHTHPLLTIDGWKEIKDLKKGSKIATPRKIDVFGKYKLKNEKIKIIAYLLAKGDLSNGNILFSNSDNKILNDFKKSLKIFDKDLKIKPYSKKTYKIVNTKINKNTQKSKNEKNSLKKYLEENNLYEILKKEKEIPKIIFKLPKKELKLFLNRLFSCNGEINKNKEWEISYSSFSKKMINQIQSLLLRFGILSIIKTKKIKDNLNYEIKIFSQSNLDFKKKIGFFSQKKLKLKNIKAKKINSNIDNIPKKIWENYNQKNLSGIEKLLNYKIPKSIKTSINYSISREKLLKIAKADKNKYLEKLATSDIFWDEIIEIKEIKGKKTVYDITVPKNHNFLANNIIVHNSYTMSVLMEEFARQPFEIKERLSVLIIDTVGIFWTMKYKNEEIPKEVFDKWELKAEGINIRAMIPYGKQEFYKEKEIPFDQPFSIRTSQMDLEDWLGVFRLSWRDPESSLLSRTIDIIKQKVGSLYDIDDIIKVAKQDPDSSKEIQDALINRMKVAKSWGLFSKTGTTIKEFARAGTITTIDVSTYKQSIGMESIQELIVGLLGKRLYEERMLYRKEEEKNLVQGKRKESEMPIVWMMIDEAHMFMPQDRPSMALDVLLQWIRVGRQPGLSLLLATQRPNKLHSEAISQCDFFLSMRMTAQDDIQAVSAIRPSYLKIPMDKYYAQMPKGQGFAILIDDNSEKVMMLKIRPRITWDGGKTANVFSD